MKSKISYIIKEDFNGFFMGKLKKYRILLMMYISTIYTYIKIAVYNIKIGGGCKFYGTPILTRSFKSKIVIGSNCTFRSDRISNLVGINRKCTLATLKEDAILTIGDHSGFSGAVIVAAESITIGKNVLCGGNVTITDFDWHAIHPDDRKVNRPAKMAPVIIENNVWLGLNTVVLKGVTIGKNTVIGANSLVVKNIPENVIAAGNPCKVIKKMDETFK